MVHNLKEIVKPGNEDFEMEGEKNKIFCTDKNILFILGAKAVTLYGRIYIKKSAWDKMSTLHKSALFIHETTHILQQKKYGLKWYVKYALSKKFRLEQELEGYGNAMKFMINIYPDMKKQLLLHYAERLSGKIYLYMTSFTKASNMLEEYINKLE